MIQHSFEWKVAIKRNNAYARRVVRAGFPEDEAILDRLQIRLVTNALMVRRLLETAMVATALRKLRINVRSFPWAGKLVDSLNNHKVFDKYQFNNEIQKDLRLDKLCNQVIHSFVWGWVCGEDETVFDSFMVSSDTKKHSELFIVNISDYCDMTQEVANSWPSEVQSVRDSQTLQWKHVAK